MLPYVDSLPSIDDLSWGVVVSSSFNTGDHCSASWMEHHPHCLCRQPKGHRDAHVCSSCGQEFVPVLERGDA
jgi:hypothetical protein